MTNEEIIKRLESIAFSAEIVCDGLKVGAITKECFEAIQETARLAISALSRDRWISVEERLPEDCVDVLTISDHGNYHVMSHYYGLEHPFGIDEKNPRYWPVTHWMPLPEPPKEET